MATGFQQRYKGRIKANLVSADYLGMKAAVGLTAVGTSQANGLQLSASTNIVATAASSAVGVILPAGGRLPLGAIVRVYNDGPANSFHVYGSGSDTIDGVAGATGVPLTNAFFADYVLTSITNGVGAWTSYRQAITRSA